MNDHDETRRAEELENDIERTRAEVSSTIDAIQSKLTPGQMMDQAFAYARTSLPADFGVNLGNTVRDNPIPVALIGVGVAWLMMRGPQSDGLARERRLAAEYEAGLSGGAYFPESDDRSAEGSKVGRVITKVSTKARDLKDQASEAGHNLSEKASELGQRISGTASSLAGQARETMSSAREKVSGSAGGARSRASEIGERSQERYYRTKGNVSHMLDEQPLLVGALGLAVGTLLGAALPSTRREDRLMGGTRDNMMQGAMEVAREKGHAVKESAQRVAQTAQQEAEAATKEAPAARAQGNGDATARQAGTPDLSSGNPPPSESLH